MKRAILSLGLGMVIILTGRSPVAVNDDGSRANAQEPAESELSPEQQAIQNNAVAFVNAFNDGDAKRLAALFAPTGQMSVDGDTIATGREEIEKAYEDFFKDNPGAQISVMIDSIRLLGPNLAVEKGASQLLGTDDAADVLDAYTLVHVKQDDNWLTATADVVQRSAIPPIDWKAELAVLEGKWIAEARGWKIETTIEWVADGNFLKRSFEVTNESKPESSGVQIIGWDPIEGAITSWAFGSDGGHGRGWWTRDGNDWEIQSEGTTADGEIIQATNVITLLGEDSFRWQSTQRSIDGFVLEDTDSIRVRRVKQNN